MGSVRTFSYMYIMCFDHICPHFTLSFPSPLATGTLLLPNIPCYIFESFWILFLVVLGFELMILCLLGNGSTPYTVYSPYVFF
jgi:hypothetical protein